MIQFFSDLQDFGDGGAFPEIHVAQYPFNLLLICKITTFFLVGVNVSFSYVMSGCLCLCD